MINTADKMKILLVICVFLCDFTLGAKLPPEFKICRRDDPDLVSCFKEAVKIALPLLRNGIPELNVPAAEPLVIESMMVKGSGGSVNLDQLFKNINIFHVTEGIISDAEFSLIDDNLNITMKGVMPETNIIADYTFDGKVLMLPIKGDGKAYMDFKNSNVVVKMNCDKIQKKGKDYVTITFLSVDLEPSEAHFNFENLFNGDEAMGKQMNAIINENWKELFAEVKEGYDVALSAVVNNVASAIFNKVPMEDLFPH